MATGQDNSGKTLNERLAESGATSGYSPQSNGGSDGDSPAKGYKIIIGILAVVLVALSLLYFNIHSQQQSDYTLLSEDRETVQENLSQIIVDFDDLKTTNSELKRSMEIEKQRADSIITQLKNERSFNYTKLKKYENEVGTLRTLMRGYLQQIDSLNNLNQQLISENVSYKKQISTVELRAEEAEERARELNDRIRIGSRLRAENINLVTINAKGRQVSRAKRAARLSVNFTIAANDLTLPGDKQIVARIVSPDGYALTTDDIPTIVVNGETLTYSATREVDFQNASLPVSIFYAGTGFVGGIYTVELYHENNLIGTEKIVLR